jgi:MFS family permease
MPEKRKFFYGWWIVLASAILNVLAGGTFYYGFTIFFNPIRDTFRWSAAVTSVAFVFQRLESGLLGPVAGYLVDRTGPRKLMLAGWAVVGIGFLLMSRINSLWAFYCSFVIIATGFSFGSFVVLNTIVALWFEKKRSRAMTFIYLGFGASGTLVPLIALAIEQFGWRETLTVLAVVLWIIGILLSLVMRHKPEQYGLLPDGRAPESTRQSTPVLNALSTDATIVPASISPGIGFSARAVLKTRAFWLFSLCFFFQHIGTSAVMVHIVPYLESEKLPTTLAAMAVTGMTLCSVIGRLVFGLMGDFANKRYLVAIALVFQTVGLFIFSFIDASKAWLIIPFLLIYAPGYGGTIPLRPVLQADLFGTKSFGTIMGLSSAISMTSGLFSPVIAGWLFDTTGSYSLAWQIFAAITVPAIVLILLTKPPAVKQETSLKAV